MVVRCYEDANKLLQGRNRSSKKLENNTYLERRDDCIVVKLHSTYIIHYKPDGSIQLRNGGWDTPVTQDRINRYTPSNMRVFSAFGTWYLALDSLHYGFGSGIDIAADGKPEHNQFHVDDAYKFERTRRNKEMAERGVFKLRYWIKQAKAHKPGKLTVDKILAEENASVRVAMMGAYGMDRFLLAVNPAVLGREAGYDLLSFGPYTNWVGDTVKALKMTCPSTGAVYINMVPPHMRTVSEAVDWMFDCKDYLVKIAQQT